MDREQRISVIKTRDLLEITKQVAVYLTEEEFASIMKVLLHAVDRLMED